MLALLYSERTSSGRKFVEFSFSVLKIRKKRFDECDFERVKFEHVEIDECSFSKCNFDGLRLVGNTNNSEIGFCRGNLNIEAKCRNLYFRECRELDILGNFTLLESKNNNCHMKIDGKEVVYERIEVKGGLLRIGKDTRLKLRNVKFSGSEVRYVDDYNIDRIERVSLRNCHFRSSLIVGLRVEQSGFIDLFERKGFEGNRGYVVVDDDKKELSTFTMEKDATIIVDGTTRKTKAAIYLGWARQGDVLLVSSASLKRVGAKLVKLDAILDFGDEATFDWLLVEKWVDSVL